jgi:hypothetical protein
MRSGNLQIHFPDALAHFSRLHAARLIRTADARARSGS